MQEEWAELEEFPDYAISNFGDIANMKTGMPRKASRNQQGIYKISLYQGRRLITRSMALLVAQAFVEGQTAIFDTPIHLDGDRANYRADNLMWRPRWFAIKYHKQFRYEDFYNQNVHLVELESGKHYNSIQEACVTNGLYFQDIIKSYVERTFVFPTQQEFRYIQDTSNMSHSSV